MFAGVLIGADRDPGHIAVCYDKSRCCVESGWGPTSGPLHTVPLSTINYAVDVVTRMAIDRLMQLIAAGDQLPEPRVTLIDPELIIRASIRARS